jgi:hypothetical protein
MAIGLAHVGTRVRAEAVRNQALLPMPSGDDTTYGEQGMQTENDTTLDAYVDAAAQMLGLPVEPEWKPAVKAGLKANLRHAAAVGEVELPDEAEPACVFGP